MGRVLNKRPSLDNPLRKNAHIPFPFSNDFRCIINQRDDTGRAWKKHPTVNDDIEVGAIGFPYGLRVIMAGAGAYDGAAEFLDDILTDAIVRDPNAHGFSFG